MCHLEQHVHGDKENYQGFIWEKCLGGGGGEKPTIAMRFLKLRNHVFTNTRSFIYSNCIAITWYLIAIKYNCNVFDPNSDTHEYFLQYIFEIKYLHLYLVRQQYLQIRLKYLTPTLAAHRLHVTFECQCVVQLRS